MKNLLLLLEITLLFAFNLDYGYAAIKPICPIPPPIYCKKPLPRLCEIDPKLNKPCIGTQICCDRECGGSFCFQPPIVIGCPTFTPEHREICKVAFSLLKNPCTSDKDCKRKQKCCPSLCGGHSCIASKPKAGSCPKLNPDIFCTLGGIKADDFQCGVDKDCPGKQKCCATECGGLSCKDPELKPEVPCYPKNFPINCVCKPCKMCKGKRYRKCQAGNWMCKARKMCCCCLKNDWKPTCSKKG